MGYTTITPGTTISSTWGNEVRDQLVTPVGNAATRSALITAPENGMLTTITAANASNGIEHFNGTSWRKPWNMPWGVVASVVNTASATQTISAGTTSVLTSLSSGSLVTVANRYWMVTMEFAMTATTNTAVGTFYVARGAASNTTTAAGTTKAQIVMGPGTTPLTYQHSEIVITTTSAGIFYNAAVTATVQAPQISVTTGTPTSLFIIDMGPSGAPS